MRTTYYPELKAATEAFVLKHPKGYEECLEALRKFSEQQFNALHLQSHPITHLVDTYTVAQLEFIIKEYSAFSNEAIHMLLDAMIRNHDWKELFKELQRNIDEEKGEETMGIPHLEMMRQGYRRDLGIETDKYTCSMITRSFLEKMRAIFKNPDNAFSAGALIAFEGTAIAEFHIVDKIVRTFDDKWGDSHLKGKTTLTSIYIDGHKDFEIGHEAHLMSSIKPYITEKNIDKMVRGYLMLCATMNNWWEQLAQESFDFSLNNVLSDFPEEDYEVANVFFKE